MKKLLIDVDAFADAFRPDSSGEDKEALKAFVGRFEVESGDCAGCGTKYRPAMYPCNQCKDSPNMISHRTPKTTRLNKYFIGAPVFVRAVRGPGDTTRPDLLRPYEGPILDLPSDHVRLPTVSEAVERCPGLWLIPWRERPGNLIKIHFQAWFKNAGSVITYEPGKIMSEDRWQDVKAIQILPELRK